MVRKMSVRAEDEEDVIDVDVSDDEKYHSDNVFQGLWIPYPDQVAEMFEKLDKGGVPVLKWRCPGRRPPEVEKEEEDMETDLNLAVEPTQEEQKEEKKAPQPTEFDFDDTSLETSTKLTPRKTPGSSKGKKRVARMDKVLDDMIRQRKATEASKDQRKKASPKTPRGAGGGRFFSSPRTPMSAEKYAPSISPLSTPRGSGAKSPHNRLMGAKYTPPYRSVSPRTPSSPKTPTSAEKMPTPSTSPVGCMKTSTDKDLSPSVAKMMEFDASEFGAKTTCISTMVTSASSTTKCTPLTQALMSEPMVSSHLSDNSLFNKPRNSLPQVTTHPVSTTATTTTASSIGAPANSSLSTNSSAHAATHQHFAVAQTVGGQRPSLSLFSHQNSGVGQGSPQAGIARGVTQVHLPNSPLSQPVQSPHAQSPLSQPAHSPMTHTSQSPMSYTVHSPMTQLSQSPLSQPVHSPMSQTTHSPISQPIQSPMSQHSQSPMTQLAHSPMAQPAQSPMSQPAQSPTAQSPLAQPVQSPSASQSPISQVGQLRGTVQQNMPGAKPRLTLSGKPRVSITDKPKLSMASKPRLSLASPLTVSTSTIQSHLSSTPTLQAQLNQAVQHQVLQQHLSQTTQQQQQSQLVQQQRAQAMSQQQQINQAVAQHQMVSVTEPAQAQMSQQQQLTQQQQQQLAQQLQLNQQSQAQLNQQQHLAQQQQQLAQQQLSQQQLQQLSQQQVQTPQLTPQQQQQLTLALAQQQLNQQQSGTQSMSPQMAQQLNQLIKQQRIQLTLRPQRAAQQQQQQQQLAQVKAQQLVSTQQLVQQQLAQINAQQMAQTTLQPQQTQSTVQTSQTTAQPNVTTASPAPKIWSKPSAQHQLLQAALSQVPQNQTSLNQMIQAVKSRMNPATHPQLFKSISQLTQTSQPQSQGAQLHTLTNPSPSLSSLVMASQSSTTPTHSASAVSFPSSDNVQNTSQASGHLTQVVYNSQASLVTNPSHIGAPPTTSVAQAVAQQPSSAITQPSLLVRKEETIPAHQTQLGLQRNDPTDYKLSIFTQASTPSANVTTAESVAAAQFVSQAQVARTDASHLSRQLPNMGRKSSLTGESGGLSTQLTASETPTSQTGMIVGQSSHQVPTTQTRFVPSNLLQPSTESTLLTRERFVTPSDAIASNQERFTLATMNQAMNRAAHPAVSQASELSSPSGRERLTLASMLQPFDLAGLSQQEKQTLSTLTQSRDLSFLQNCTSEGEGTTGASQQQQFSTINKAASNVGFSQSHMQIGESQVSPVSQSYIMPSYGVSAMIGKPPPPYSVAIAEKALSTMRTSMAGRKDTNIVTQLPPATVTSASEKTVAFVKKPETSMPSTTVAVWVTTPNTSSEVGSNIASSHSSVVTSQLGVNSQPVAAGGGAQVSVQKISLQQSQQSSVTGDLNKALTDKDDKQTLDLVNTSLSAVRSAINNQMYPQTVSKDNLLIRKNLLGFSLNKPSTASDMSSVTTSGTSSIASNNSLLQHMLGTSSSDHSTTTTSHLIPSVSTHELNLQKMSLSSASVTSNSNFGALTSSLSHSQPQPSTIPSTPSTRPRLTTIAALLNIDSSAKTQAELQLRQLSMAGISTDGSSAMSSLGQTLSIISPVTAVTKTVNPSSITTASQVTMVPALTSKPNPSSQVITNTGDNSQTEQQQQHTPVSES